MEPAKLSALEQLGELAFEDPLAITQERFIIDGYARWEVAKRRHCPKLNCIVYDLTSDEALEVLVRKHSGSEGLTDFIRIQLALDLEPHFRKQGLINQQAGGQGKGSSKLAKAQQVDSRRDVARIAGVCPANVSKVKNILAHACSSLLQSARTREISIHLADKWSQEPESKQRECLRLLRIERGIKRRAQNLVAAELARVLRSKADQRVISFSDFVGLLHQVAAAAPEQAKEFGSITVKLLDRPGRAIFITEDLIHGLLPQQEVLIK